MLSLLLVDVDLPVLEVLAELLDVLARFDQLMAQTRFLELESERVRLVPTPVYVYLILTQAVLATVALSISLVA